MMKSRELLSTTGQINFSMSPSQFPIISTPTSLIVNELRESFFSLYNHFVILAAELMEKFLLCNNCSTPIGFPHQPLCLTKSLSVPSIWKKTRYDDKFITFGMNFCFSEIFKPRCRKNILTQIANSCLKQSITQRHEKTSLSYSTKSWPMRWMRGDKEKKNKEKRMQIRTVYGCDQQPSMFSSSPWTPKASDAQTLGEKSWKFSSNSDWISLFLILFSLWI